MNEFLNALFPISALAILSFAIWAVYKENANCIPPDDNDDIPIE